MTNYSKERIVRTIRSNSVTNSTMSYFQIPSQTTPSKAPTNIQILNNTRHCTGTGESIIGNLEHNPHSDAT